MSAAADPGVPESLRERVLAVPFKRLVWLVPIAFALHEAEEWNILGWYHVHFTNPPDSTQLAVYTWLVFISVVAFAWTGLACLLPKKACAMLVLPFATTIFANALQHVYWTVAFRDYAPGVVASVLTNIPTILLVTWHGLRNGLLPWPYVLVCYALAIPQVVGVVQAGHTVSGPMQAIHRFSMRLAEALFGP
jgi:hypothetical protein